MKFGRKYYEVQIRKQVSEIMNAPKEEMLGAFKKAFPNSHPICPHCKEQTQSIDALVEHLQIHK